MIDKEAMRTEKYSRKEYEEAKIRPFSKEDSPIYSNTWNRQDSPETLQRPPVTEKLQPTKSQN